MLDKQKSDSVLYEITRPMWYLLSILSVYVFYTAFRMTEEPELSMGLYFLLPQMLECVAAGAVAILVTSVLFEYISHRSGS